MIDQKGADLEALVTTLESAGSAPDSDALLNVAITLGKVFGVDADEVAILKLDAKSKSLKFVLPEKLAPVGSIPLTSTTALAARTARERKPDMMNNFSGSRHTTVFEAVPLGRDPSEMIQKIISVPILDGTHVLGVVQISRKGRTLRGSGPDFTQKDLNTLASLNPILERFLKLAVPVPVPPKK